MPLVEAQFRDAKDGFALLGDGTALSTADGGMSFSRRIAVLDKGATWVTGSVPTSQPTTSPSFFDATTGDALDAGCDLWKTANRGASRQILDPGPDANTRRWSPSDPGASRCWAARRRVCIDDGGSFDRVTDPLVRKAKFDTKLMPVRKGLLLVGKGLPFSANNRTKWTLVERPMVGTKQVGLASIDCTVRGACVL